MTERHYEVEARTIDEVVHRLNGMRLEGSGGRRSQGMTQYDIRPRYRAVAGGGICKLEGLSVEVRIVMTLPMWPGVVDRPEAEQEKWRTIAGAVRDHEHAHRDLSVQAAAELAESLRGREARGCGTLRQVVRGELSIHGARLREAHAAYDRETDRTLTPGRL